MTTKTAAKTRVVEETAVSVWEAPNALAILTDAEKFDKFYEDVKAETDKLEVDLTTEVGRKRIASMAFKVARTKTMIDDAGKLLTQEWRDKITAVDAARRNIRDRLDTLKAEVRAPLTIWEEEEAARLERVDKVLADWRASGLIGPEDDSASVAGRLKAVQAQDIDSDEFGSHFDIAVALRGQVIDALTAGHARLLKEEADREELERLRAEQAERELHARAVAEAKAEEERQAQAEAERQAQADAAEAARQAAIKAAEERAVVEAQRAAEEQRLAAERAHAEALAAEKRRADAAEAAIKAKAVAEAEATRQRQVEADRLAAEQTARDEDRKHRGAVMGVAKAAIMALGVEEDVAKKIVLAIVAGEIPAVSLRF